MYRTILLAYDGTVEGRLALREGARLAQLCNAKVVLLAVVEPEAAVIGPEVGVTFTAVYRTEEYAAILEEGTKRLNRMALSHEARLEHGQPVERITAVAKEVAADLVVIAHHRQNMLERWIRGSVTGALSDLLSCSLLVAHQEISDEALFGTLPSGDHP